MDETDFGAGESAPDQSHLTDLFARAHRILIYTNPPSTQDAASLLKDVTERRSIEILYKALSIENGPAELDCMFCMGGPSIRLFENGVLIADLVVHHLQYLTWSGWSTSARIASPEILSDWLLAEIPQLMSPQEKRQQQSYQLWERNIPNCLKALISEYYDGEFLSGLIDMREEPRTPNKTEVLTRLRSLLGVLEGSYESKEEAIKDLYAWSGSGSEDWTSYAAYELIPLQLLYEFDTESLIEQMMREDLSDLEKLGASRFFCSSDFLQNRLPQEISLFTRPVREKIAQPINQSGDEYKESLYQDLINDAIFNSP